MADYLIIGGHGKVALLAAPLLVGDGHTVTSVIREPGQGADIEATGAEPLVLDVEHAGSDDLVAAMEGRDAIVWSAGAGGSDAARTFAVDRDAAIRSMDAAAQAGVRRYVMVSYLGARRDHGVPGEDSFFPYAESKAVADEYLRGTSLEWTILGPGFLTLDDPSGRISLTAADDVEKQSGTDSGEVARGNVARVIVAALDMPETAGKQIEFVDGDTPIRDALAAAPRR